MSSVSSQGWRASENAAIAAFDSLLGEQRRKGKKRVNVMLNLAPDVRTDELLFIALIPRLQRDGLPIRVCSTAADRMSAAAQRMGADLRGVVICGWDKYSRGKMKMIRGPDPIWQVNDWNWGPYANHVTPEIKQFCGLALRDALSPECYDVLSLRKQSEPVIEQPVITDLHTHIRMMKYFEKR